MRVVKTQEAILDILDYVPNGTFMTMGYITPVTSFKFPKKPNGRNNDYDKFYENIGALIGANEPICGIIKIKKYNFQFFDRNYMGKHYGNFRPELEKRYGEQGKTIDAPKAPKKTPIDFGKGIDRTSLDNLMSAQNVYSAKTVSKYYPVLTNGNIGNEIDKELLKDLWTERTVPQTVKAQIRAALEDEMKYRYQNFKLDSILYIATTLNKEKILYINENVVLSVGHSKNAMINVNSSALVPFAKNEYDITEAGLKLKTYIKNLINETVLEMRSDRNFSQIYDGKTGGTYNGARYLSEAIKYNHKMALCTNLNEGIQFEPSENEKGGIIVLSTDVNAVKQSENRVINFLKQKMKTITNRFTATKKIDKIASENELIGWTIGHFFNGRYTSPKNGKQYGENSLSIEIIGVDFDKLYKIAMEVCDSFEQESVLLKDYSSGRVLFVDPN